MGFNIKKTAAYCLISILACFALTGCDLVPSLNLTDEQSNLIAEYAAGKLIEYVKGHPGGLMILEDVDRAEVNPGLKKEEESEQDAPLLPGTPNPPQDAPALPESDEPVADAPTPPEQDDAIVDAPVADAQPTVTLAEALGLQGAVLTYDHYEVTPTYPENAQELAFSMKAAPDKELLVVHFALSNPTDVDMEAHTDSNDFKVRIVVNGGDKIRGDITFLDNDLMNYKGLLTPGSSVDSVFVFEIPQETQISTMDLVVVVDDNEQKYGLIQ